MRTRKFAIRLEPVPLTILVLLVLLIAAVIFLAPAENAQAALSGTSILSLVVQASVKSALSISKIDNEE